MSENHEGFCVKSFKYRIPETNVPPTEDFDFAEALESVYPLLETVFSYLNYQELKICCQVKKSWEEVAETVLSRRTTPSWFTCYKVRGRRKNKGHVFKHSTNLNNSNVGTAIILYDYCMIKLHEYICLHTDNFDLSRKTVPEYLEEEIIPQNTDYCVLSCAKVVSCFEAPKEQRSSPSCDIIVGLIIPKIPNVRTAMFHYKVNKKDATEIGQYVRENDQVKCLLMFSTRNLNKSAYNGLLTILIPECFAQMVAVGGGIIMGTKTFQHVKPTKRVYSSSDIFCIAFIQDRSIAANFNAYSYVILGDDLTKEDFTKELQKFRSNIKLREKSVAFRICCSAKVGAEEETALVNKVFPNIPVLGFNAGGELGWNCFSNTMKDGGEDGIHPKKRIKQKYPSVYQQWSTVLVILTWS
ncbi:unnamed protein product [Acanthoscelides obtectus]|uniref:Uncharacterized protein n=1 Tax=Acanthoscelides obtectus TaxID=200917 RepID=A0A9P0K7N1_ACAOB|nr:unnamed protein product [Acanthoscelides obtectus]CAK1667350.1 hypothetical protein AOBTE_LOCUS25794 [Acanthoscelides obtectus]